MYYIVTEYEMPRIMSNVARKLITIGNKKSFTDMYDYDSLAKPDKVIIPDKALKDFMKNGFATKDEAENANELKEAIIYFIGPFSSGIEFQIMSEDELLAKYKTLV